MCLNVFILPIDEMRRTPIVIPTKVVSRFCERRKLVMYLKIVNFICDWSINQQPANQMPILKSPEAKESPSMATPVRLGQCKL